jgi:hypothetical protein
VTIATNLSYHYPEDWISANIAESCALAYSTFRSKEASCSGEKNLPGSTNANKTYFICFVSCASIISRKCPRDVSFKLSALRRAQKNRMVQVGKVKVTRVVQGAHEEKKFDYTL